VRRTFLAAVLLAMRCFDLGAQTPTAADWMERGRSDLKRFFFTVAEVDFRSAIVLDPASASAYVGLTRALLGELPPNLHIAADVSGILPKAEAAARKANDLSPRNAEALCVLGIVNYKIALTLKDGDQRAARLNETKDDFTRALDVNPRLAQAYYRLGYMIHDQIGKPLIGAVMAAETAAMSMHPGLIQDGSARSSVRSQYSDSVEEAISYTERALAIDPGYDAAAQQRSELLKLRAILRENVSAQ
jgi:tetratricopeptide (TPR) repeat protein